ncbi:sugar phosphate isomerase/epimerase family protein [Jannaschia rubra]|uniref:Xylose isomerase n=1 Tax=Jannaschia rubra TaxID=282197 RepID=A0A0M6XWD9_9RHOB|nr:sugar phosphate isomerase/epimerase family protein [Jannaschia rubra]CTQ34613.1 Xylose isomerase [Jannaschia rubra]SFG71917.1 xylose isomerase [Jannaschia rubra]
MTRPNRPRYAARLNAFRQPGEGIAGMIAAAGRVGGLDAADLNYPDHFDGQTPEALSGMLGRAGMALNGLAMRYYTEPAFSIGAFTNPDRTVRQKAIDLTRQGIDACRAMGGGVMTLWMGQDGFDYAFQGDYARMWDDTVAALQAVADHDPQMDVAVEYKPNEPRAHALMPDVGTTLLGVREADRPNLGVTLDFAHVLYADEMPAHTAHLIARHSRLLGVHLNDGYGKRDDGLMAGTVHPVATVELFVELGRIGYDGVIYFDTFPDHGGLDPVEEARTNIALVERLRTLAGRIGDLPDLRAAIDRQDAAASQRIVAREVFGA